MEAFRFDHLTRIVSASRRQAVLAALAFLGLRPPAADAERICRPAGKICLPERGITCCGKAVCQNGRCRCPAGSRREAGHCVAGDGAGSRRCHPKCRGGQKCRRGRCRCRRRGKSCTSTRGCCKGRGLVCRNRVCQPRTPSEPCTVCPSGCPYPTLQAAVTASPTGATIRVCTGTLTGAAAKTIIDKNLTIIGAGDDAATGTTLDAAGLINPVLAIAEGTTVRISDLRITGGTDQAGAASGGGLRVDGDLTVSDATINGNTGTSGGGVFVSGTGSLAMTGCTVSGNEALRNSNGGGIYTNGPTTLTDCDIIGNRAFGGGGLLVQGPTVNLNGTDVTGNTATGNPGGGIRLDGGTVNFTEGSSVTGNSPDNCAIVSGTFNPPACPA